MIVLHKDSVAARGDKQIGTKYLREKTARIIRLLGRNQQDAGQIQGFNLHTLSFLRQLPQLPDLMNLHNRVRPRIGSTSDR
ncbi:hypothetical protein [Bradyrhizobium sp. AZCC 2230]|uniref:hypothetical protein n=1 Tax=Bradyrhizobium sp. AZCC 2230 TaxID=3117021 RepID=UPI002FF23B7E